MVPPRPIPEPLAWPGSGNLSIWLLAASVLLVVLVAARYSRRSRRQNAMLPRTLGHSTPLGPTAILIDRAERAREVLVGRFGPSWVSRTTEEIAASADVGKALNPENTDRLIALLRAADRAKFAVAEISAEDLAFYSEDWLNSVLAELAGATTSRNGKWSEPTSGPSARSNTAKSSERKA